MALDLLRFSPLRRAIKRGLLPLGAQSAVLLALATIIVLCWEGGEVPRLLRPPSFIYLNLGGFLVWVVFWPVVVLVAVMLGRFWCTVCPVELLTSASSAVGLKRRFPRALRNVSLMVLGYFLVRTTITVFEINHFPRLTAVYLLSLVGVAVLVGLVFERRAFCAYICPVGALLGLYAKCASLELRTRSGDICRKCKRKPCLTSKNKLFGRACPNFLSPPRLSDNAPCVLCFQCVQACPNDNFRLSLRLPLRDIVSGGPLDIWWALFLVPLYGNILHELGEEWKVTEALAFGPPHALAEALGLSGRWEGVFVSVWLYIALPLFVLLLPAMLARFLRSRRGIWAFFRAYSPALIPAIAGGHATKAIFKIVERGAFLPLALSDPVGGRTAAAIVAGRLAEPSPLLPLPVMGVIGLAVLLASWAGSAWAARRIGQKRNMGRGERASMQVGIAFIGLHALSVAASWLVGG